MKFKRIFGKKGDGRLWSVCNSEIGSTTKSRDVFSQLFDCWNDTAYLQYFFTNNANLLASPYWGGISIDEAIDKVLEEAYDFELELRNIETKQAGFAHLSMADIFENFDKDMYVLDGHNLFHKKAKPKGLASMLRIYACEFDEAYIVTGGIIKLTHQLDQEIKNREKAKMNAVLQFLRGEHVYNKEELDEL